MCQAKNHVVPIAVTPRTILESGKLQNEMHAGLWMDKFVQSWNQQDPTKDWQNSVQRPAIEEVVRLSQNSPKNLDFAKLLARHRLLTHREPTKTFLATAISPFALHLARASALENASVCLHPIYGFAYIPGSGLKGMAHAYACEIFLPTQADPEQAWSDICNVFGHAPSPWLRDLAKSLDNRFGSGVGKAKIIAPRDASTGSVVFHDAWPAQWPKLICDIVNCHHTDYYGASDKNVPPPGDWENPNPVYFAAIAPNTTFEFAISPRGCTRLTATPSACASSITELATQWLAGALTHLGAGAKTNAGYGPFRIDDDKDLVEKVAAVWESSKSTGKTRAEFTATLKLITPAFLAGADQYGENAERGCDLRPATLRGQLRWWWRTMHAGHLDPATLRQLETAIWGDSKTGGAVRIELVATARGRVEPVPGKAIQKRDDRDVLRADGEFASENQLERPPEKRTSGFLYLTYGMDEMPAGSPRKQRQCLMPASSWTFRLIARDGQLAKSQTSIPSGAVIEEAKNALWLLCQFGGVGSKSRKGFGSIQTNLALDLPGIEAKAQRIRAELAIDRTVDAPPEIPSLNHAIVKRVKTPWKNYWYLLDQVGLSIQQFAQLDGQKRNWMKEVLGLPRKIGKSDRDGSRDFDFNRTFDKQTKGEVVWLGQNHKYLGNRDPKDMRHSSPLFIHVSTGVSAELSLTFIAFPSAVLPDIKSSRDELQSLLDHLAIDMAARVSASAGKGANILSKTALSSNSTNASAKRANGTLATVKILGVRGKGGFEVQEDGKPKGVLNLGAVPTPSPELESSQTVFIHDDNPTCPQYRWDNPHAGKTPKNSSPKKKGWK